MVVIGATLLLCGPWVQNAHLSVWIGIDGNQVKDPSSLKKRKENKNSRRNNWRWEGDFFLEVRNNRAVSPAPSWGRKLKNTKSNLTHGRPRISPPRSGGRAGGRAAWGGHLEERRSHPGAPSLGCHAAFICISVAAAGRQSLPGWRLMDESGGTSEEEAVALPANVNKVAPRSSEEVAARK